MLYLQIKTTSLPIHTITRYPIYLIIQNQRCITMHWSIITKVPYKILNKIQNLTRNLLINFTFHQNNIFFSFLPEIECYILFLTRLQCR